MSPNVPPILCLVIASSDACIICVLFDQGCSSGGFFQEALSLAFYLAYVSLCIFMLTTFWLSEATTLLSRFPCLLWQAFLFWSRFYYTLFWPSAKGRSVWHIITDSNDYTNQTSTQPLPMPSRRTFVSLHHLLRVRLVNWHLPSSSSTQVRWARRRRQKRGTLSYCYFTFEVILVTRLLQTLP